MSSFAAKSPLVEKIVEREAKIVEAQNDFNRHLSAHKKSAILQQVRFDRRRKWWTKSVPELMRRLESFGTILSAKDYLEFEV